MVFRAKPPEFETEFIEVHVPKFRLSVHNVKEQTVRYCMIEEAQRRLKGRAKV